METVVRDWPDTLPPVRRLPLYAPADKAGLWAPGRRPGSSISASTCAASSASPGDRRTRPTWPSWPTPSPTSPRAWSTTSPWSATTATRRPVRQDPGTRRPGGPSPFLWINPPGGGGLSSEIEEFIPGRLRWAVPPVPVAAKTAKSAEHGGSELPSNRRTAGWLMKEIPPGRFRAEDVRRIVERHCPAYPAAQPAGACGSFLAQQLMPLLETGGIRLVRQKPRIYERAG